MTAIAAAHDQAEDHPNWTPVLRGDVYCSSGCGNQCKKADYDKAVADSAELAHFLGDGWEPHVWENLGWYWSVKKGVVAVRASSGGRYHVMLNTSQQFMGYADNKDGILPMVDALLTDAEAYVTDMTAKITFLRGL